ncbi:MAG TPA: hypothetical protein VMK12_16110 [Anaeromyxobacteraceae bacterium]|nr:hypothetical protein [Anaeromyxobacteraceae bacterium]
MLQAGLSVVERRDDGDHAARASAARAGETSVLEGPREPVITAKA